ncbi:hypothetical protein GALL_284240 [mine drainage metagenome]|uniref:Uncharacterized protein n=1 Tax=mine drainage metagenome TaxID=410659 RepID=A0A1J5RNL4_9ZZZZ
MAQAQGRALGACLGRCRARLLGQQALLAVAQFLARDGEFLLLAARGDAHVVQQPQPLRRHVGQRGAGAARQFPGGEAKAAQIDLDGQGKIEREEQRQHHPAP